MAKLNGVFVSEDARKIIVGGVEYVKTEGKSAGKAEAGDIVRMVAAMSSEHYGSVTKGAFYIVDSVDSCEDVQITDDRDSSYDTVGDTLEVFKREKVASESEPVAAARLTTPLSVGDYAKVIDDSGSSSFKVGDIVRKTEERHYGGKFSYIDGTEPERPFMDAEYYVRATDDEVAEAKAKSVKVGDYVRITQGQGNWPTGTIVKVTEIQPSGHSEGVIKATDGKNTYLSNKYVPATAKEVAEVERKKAEEEAAAQRKRFVVGAIVRLTIAEGRRPKHHWGNVKNGDVGTIFRVNGDNVYVNFPSQDGWLGLISEFTVLTAEELRLEVGDYARVLVDGKDVDRGGIVRIEEDDRTSVPFKGRKFDGSAGGWDWFRPEQLERVTEAEAESNRKEAAETKKWAAIGRKVGEYKKGDIVENNGRLYGVVGVAEPGFIDAEEGVTLTGGHWRYKRNVKLIAPVESLFNGGAAV